MTLSLMTVNIITLNIMSHIVLIILNLMRQKNDTQPMTLWNNDTGIMATHHNDTA